MMNYASRVADESLESLGFTLDERNAIFAVEPQSVERRDGLFMRWAGEWVVDVLANRSGAIINVYHSNGRITYPTIKRS